jgi:hypothetical protein
LLVAQTVSIHDGSPFASLESDLSEKGIPKCPQALVDTGVLKSTLTDTLKPINAANLKRVHEIVESGKAIRKTVLEDF